MSIYSTTLSPSDPTPLEMGESRMTPAPWQQPSGGATTPQAAFQNDFATAQDFRDRAIAGGMDVQEADATYLAPVKVKWKTIASTPSVLASPDSFLKFNTEFETAKDNYSGQVRSGRSPKEAATISLAPVLEKWTLNPSNLVKPSSPVDDRRYRAAKLAVNPKSEISEIIDVLGPEATNAEINAMRALRESVIEKPRSSSGGGSLDDYIGKILGEQGTSLNASGAASKPTNGIPVRNKKTGQTGIKLPNGTIIPDK